MRHILGEPLFVETYEAYNGAMRVRLRTRTTEENQQIHDQMKTEVAAGLIKAGSIEYFVRTYQLTLAMSLHEIETSQEDAQDIKSFPQVTADTYGAEQESDHRQPVARAYDVLLGGESEAKTQVLMKYIREFETLTNYLVYMSSDPNFWQPTDGDISL
jgi:hypothetical protein